MIYKENKKFRKMFIIADLVSLTLYLIEKPFNAFVNRAVSDQIRVYYNCLWKYDISDPTLVDLTSNIFVLYTNINIYLYNYSLWVEPSMNIHEGKG